VYAYTLLLYILPHKTSQRERERGSVPQEFIIDDSNVRGSGNGYGYNSGYGIGDGSGYGYGIGDGSGYSNGTWTDPEFEGDDNDA
jgi:hypothetical protein